LNGRYRAPPVTYAIAWHVAVEYLQRSQTQRTSSALSAGTFGSLTHHSALRDTQQDAFFQYVNLPVDYGVLSALDRARLDGLPSNLTTNKFSNGDNKFRKTILENSFSKEFFLLESFRMRDKKEKR
jgi:hypothetical protein